MKREEKRGSGGHTGVHSRHSPMICSVGRSGGTLVCFGAEGEIGSYCGDWVGLELFSAIYLPLPTSSGISGVCAVLGSKPGTLDRKEG